MRSGSDSAGPAVGTAFGLSMHHELYLYVHNVGMTPAEALRSATSLVAKRFKFTDRGRLAEGLNADLLLVEGNPLENTASSSPHSGAEAACCRGGQALHRESEAS